MAGVIGRQGPGIAIVIGDLEQDGVLAAAQTHDPATVGQPVGEASQDVVDSIDRLEIGGNGCHHEEGPAVQARVGREDVIHLA
jgi:hypothetical protein